MRAINGLVLCVLLGLSALLLPTAAFARTAYVTGVNPAEVIISAKSTSAELGEAKPGSYVAAIDLDSETFGPEIPLGGRGEAWAVAITPDGTRAYATDTSEDRVIPVDIATNTAAAPIAVGDTPLAIAISPDGSRALVANVLSDTVTPIDLTSDTPEPAISVGSEPTDVAITPDGSRAYVTDVGDNTVTPIDLTNDTAEVPIAVGQSPLAIAITPDGSRAYVSEPGDEAVTPIDLATGTAGAPIAVGRPAGLIAITPDGSRAYVLGFDGVVAEIDLTAGLPAAEFPFGGDFLYGLAIAADGSRAYVTDYSSGQLHSLDVPDGSLAGSFGVGEGPEGIAIVPDQGPTAAFSAAPGAVAEGESVEFDAGGSGDPDGSVARYDWDFGDGETAADAGPSPTHSYSSAGAYTVTLTVTDDEGCSTTIVFTGDTAYCNGSEAARATRTVSVVTPEQPGGPEVKTQPQPVPAAGGGALPEAPRVKRKRQRPCPTIAAARAATFTPKIVVGHMVPGVRVRLSSNRSVRLRVLGTVFWSRRGVLHRAVLGRRSKRIHGWIRLRFALPRSARSAVSFRQPVRVRLRVEAVPGGHRRGSCRTLFRRMVRTRVTNVFPRAVQRGKLPYRSTRRGP